MLEPGPHPLHPNPRRLLEPGIRRFRRILLVLVALIERLQLLFTGSSNAGEELGRPHGQIHHGYPGAGASLLVVIPKLVRSNVVPRVAARSVRVPEGFLSDPNPELICQGAQEVTARVRAESLVHFLVEIREIRGAQKLFRLPIHEILHVLGREADVPVVGLSPPDQEVHQLFRAHSRRAAKVQLTSSPAGRLAHAQGKVGLLQRGKPP